MRKRDEKKLFLKDLAEVSILQNNHLQTGWGMSTSPTRILADFDKKATRYYQKW